MSRRFLSVFIILSFFSAGAAFAAINVISPVEGEWANKQMLVIDTAGGGEYYYSLNGAEPDLFGFAYDGPVLIDMTGAVTVNITCITEDGGKENATVSYTVTPDEGFDTDYSDFVFSFFDTGIINYTAGTQIEIPERLRYALGVNARTFVQGRTLSFSSKSILSRYVPCTVQDAEKKLSYRFIIRTLPQFAGIFSRRDVPFYITNWDTITFTDESYIYKIDSGMWDMAKGNLHLDRSRSHMIYWQSIEYESGNPVEFFVLPPKPQIRRQTEADGSIVFQVDGDSSYAMSVLSEDAGEYQELFTEVGIDTFYGDRLSGTLEIGLFANSVFQGSMSVKYSIDKCPPAVPRILSDVQAHYSRTPVNIRIDSEQNSELSVKVAGPYLLEDPFTPFGEISIPADDDNAENAYAAKVLAEKRRITLVPGRFGAEYYKIVAWTTRDGKQSEPAVYELVIDQYNYYYDASAQGSLNTGTSENPYTSFAECVKGMNAGRSACLWVRGDLRIPSGTTTLTSNCVIKPTDKGSLVFAPDSSLVIKASSLELDGIRLELSDAEKSYGGGIIPMLRLENAVLDMNDCVLSVDFGKNGTVIESSSSVVNIRKTIASVNARSYTSFLTAMNSRVTVSESNINTAAETTVVLSARDSTVNIYANQLKITCNMGRVAELFGAKGFLRNNRYSCDVQKQGGNFTVVYKDKDSEITESGNGTAGF